MKILDWETPSLKIVPVVTITGKGDNPKYIPCSFFGLKVVRDSHWIQGPRYKKKSPGSRRDRGEVPIGVWEKQVMSPNP